MHRATTSNGNSPRVHRFPIDSFRPHGPYFPDGADRPRHLHIYHFPRLGDVDGDGELEIVYSKGCAGQIVFTLDGRELWRHLDPDPGAGYPVRADSLVLVFDLDGDGAAELACFRLVDGRPNLCTVEAATGTLRHAIPFEVNPRDARCSVIPAQLDGPGRPLSLVVNRDYWRVETYSHDLARRWLVDIAELGHTTLAHDVDGDGRAELFTGTRLLAADGRTRWANPGLLAGTGESHPDSVVVADLGGTGEPSLVVAAGAQALTAGGEVRWRLDLDVHEVQAVRLLRHGAGYRLCFVDLVRYQEPANILTWRGRSVPDVTCRCHLVDAAGQHLAGFEGLHTPQAGDWDGDGEDELFLLARDGRHVDVWKQSGRRVARLPVQGRVYVSDMVVAPVLPSARGAQMILHEWNEDERITTCAIYENPDAGDDTPPALPLHLATLTNY